MKNILTLRTAQKIGLFVVLLSLFMMGITSCEESHTKQMPIVYDESSIASDSVKTIILSYVW